jgi:tetratricopeptide (TPR) repeat protein
MLTKKKDNDVERKFLSHIYYLRGNLLLEGKIDRFAAEEDFVQAIELGKDQTPNTPYRAWYAMAALGSLLHRNYLIRRELYENDVFVPYPQNLQEAEEDLKSQALRAAELLVPKPVNIHTPDTGAEKRQLEFERIWNSERYKNKRNALSELFTVEKPYEGAGEWSHALNGERIRKPFPPNEVEMKRMRDQAFEYLNQAVEMNENFTDARIERGWFLTNLGHHYYPDYLERALADLNRAVEFEQRLTKQSALAYFVRGIIHFRREDYKNSLSDMNQAIALVPRCIFYYHARANVLLKLKKYRLHYNDIQKGFELYFKMSKDERRENYLNRRLALERMAQRHGKPAPGPKKKKIIKVVRKIVKKGTEQVVEK